MGSIASVSVLVLLASTSWAATVGAAESETQAPRWRSSPVIAAGIWTVAQLIPSPLLVLSSHHVGGGMQWQVTPLAYSFGVTADPWRAFVVEPSVRHAGSIELYGSPAWACCAPGENSSWIARIGTRLYLPLIERGESLSWSLGGSYYRASGGGGGTGEIGIYTLSGVFGITLMVSPALSRREVMAALAVRYF